jgi:methyl-accepting chemotaxis protein
VTKLRIRAQLACALVPPIAGCALLAIAMLAGIGMLQSAKSAVDRAAEARVVVRDLAGQIEAGRAAVRSYVLMRNPRSSGELTASFARVKRDIVRAPRFVDAREWSKLEAIVPVVAALEAHDVRLIALLDANDHSVLAAYRGRSEGRFAPAFAELQTLRTTQAALTPQLEALRVVADAATAASARRYDGLTRGFVVALIVGGGTLLTVSLMLGLAVGRRITLRLTRAVAALNDVVRDDLDHLSANVAAFANGELRTEFTTRSAPLGDCGSDEIAAVAQMHDALLTRLALIELDLATGLGNVRDLVGGVSVGSSELTASCGAATAATGASNAELERVAYAVGLLAREHDERAKAIATANDAVDELTRAAKDISDEAGRHTGVLDDATAAFQKLNADIIALGTLGERVRNAADDTFSTVAGGSDGAERTHAALVQAAAEAQNAAGGIERVEAHAGQAAPSIARIKRIAGHAHLLARVAAIEAARAGDRGRGFAIVANEIGKLAERGIAESAEMTAAMAAIGGETRAATQSLQASRAALRDGIAGNEYAEEALANVRSASDETAALTRQFGGRAAELLDISNHAAQNTAIASASLDENIGGSAVRLLLTGASVRRTLRPLSDDTNRSEAEQAALAAVSALAARIDDVDAVTRALRGRIAALGHLVARYDVDDDRPTKPPKVVSIRGDARLDRPPVRMP